MGECMLFVVVFVFETSSTIIALERWGRFVMSGLHVAIQRGVPSKSLVTQIALVLGSKVALLMLFQLLVTAKASWTELAKGHFLIGVLRVNLLFVCSKICCSEEHFVTNVAGSILTVYLHVMPCK